MHYIKSEDINNSASGNIFQSVLIIVSIFSSLIMFLFGAPQNGYDLLPVLPLSYTLLAIFSKNCWRRIPQNFGITILYSLEFIRLVISPLLVYASGYYCVITYQATNNNGRGILLLFYEAICIGLALRCKTNYKNNEHYNIDNTHSNNRMNTWMLVIVLLSIFIGVMAPEIFSGYRTIAGLFTDIMYTSIEGIQTTSAHLTSRTGKFLVVTGNYVFKVVRILLPAYVLVVLRNRLAKRYKIICYIVILSPFLFVDGTIARSIYYTIFLLILYYQLYGKDIRKMTVPIVLSAIFVVIYFVTRFYVSGGIGALNYFANKSIDYFAGANIVGGVFNLPSDLEYRFRYYLYDLLRIVPYANTLFGLNSSDYLQSFFNLNNHVTGGQIPPTIGMSSYYLGIILAPLYSVIFARMCKKYGEKSIRTNNPYFRLIYTYITFITALGICMYSIDITLITLSQVILPIYIIVNTSYPKCINDR
ncbi:hypothetical protein AALD74_18150 [Lachnospiraceae bacterium 48-21]